MSQEAIKAAVQAGGKALDRSELGKLPSLLTLWTAMQWADSQDQLVGSDAELDQGGKDIVHVYPSFQQRDTEQQVKALLKQFGAAVLRKATDRARERWKDLLVLPLKEEIDAVQDKLHQGVTNYEELVRSFTTAMGRLAALNIGNAFRANHIPPSTAKGTDIRKYGPTADYCALARYHSIIPQASAYAPSDLWKDYGTAFAEVAMHSLDKVSERSTKAAIMQLVVEVAATVR